MTVGEAAKLLGVSRATAYKAARRGEIPSIRIGTRVLVLERPLRQMLNTGTCDSPTAAELDR